MKAENALKVAQKTEATWPANSSRPAWSQPCYAQLRQKAKS